VGEQALALTRHGVASGWHLSGIHSSEYSSQQS